MRIVPAGVVCLFCATALGRVFILCNGFGSKLCKRGGRVENCFDNASYPRTRSGADDGDEAVLDADCPMNMYRSGGAPSQAATRGHQRVRIGWSGCPPNWQSLDHAGDMRADWPLMLRRLQTIVPWLGLSRPGCWAYLE